MARITVVRHLEPLPIIVGGNDIDRELSAQGIADAESLLANVKAAVDSDDVHPYLRKYGEGMSSPYARCLSTAKLIKDAVDTSWRWFEVPELRESAHREQKVTLRNKTLTHEESTFDLHDRVARFLKMIHQPVTPRLIVTHGDVVNAFRWCIEGMSLRQYRELFTDPDNFVPFGCAWTFDIDKNVAERRVLGSTTPDKVVEFSSNFYSGSDRYRSCYADFVRDR